MIYNISRILFCIIILLTFSCGEGTDPEPDPQADILAARTAMIDNVGNGMIIPSYESLEEQSEALVSRISEFQQEPTLFHLENAQLALKAAWLSWQNVSLFLFGPAESNGLRSALATYPADADKIENNIASGSYILESIDNQSAVGFPALDYLLNGLGEKPGDILSYYTQATHAEQRLAYLTDLGVYVREGISRTRSAWLPSDGNHLAAFTSETASGTDAGSSLGILINALDLHFQRFVRDGKVAIPAGIRSAGVPRPKAVEAYYGGYSVELLVASLEAYRRLFLGTAATGEDKDGLYDYLVALQAKELADDIKSQFEAAIVAASLLTDPLQDQIENDPELVNTVFLELQKIVVLLKSDMASTMGITITNQDNDGD